jgi:hypothetical protein
MKGNPQLTPVIESKGNNENYHTRKLQTAFAMLTMA